MRKKNWLHAKQTESEIQLNRSQQQQHKKVKSSFSQRIMETETRAV